MVSTDGHVLFFKLESQRAFIVPLLLQLLLVSLHNQHDLLELALLLYFYFQLGLVFIIQFLFLRFILCGDLRNEHSVLCLASVLQQHAEGLPEGHLQLERVILAAVGLDFFL